MNIARAYGVALVACAVMMLGVSSGRAGAAAAPVTDLSSACPSGVIAEDGFADVPQSSTHERAVDCVTWWRVASGSDWGGFLPASGSSRAASASFVARMLVAAGANVPTNPPDAFTDDNGSVHELAINQLAALGVVHGTAPGQFSPNNTVTRGQMATMLNAAIEARAGTPLAQGDDAFDDDNGSVHEPAINALAAAGLAAGTAPRTFSPNADVRRDQTASFLARTLDYFVQRGLVSVPTTPPPPRNSRFAYVAFEGSCDGGIAAQSIASRRLDGTGTIIAAAGDCQHFYGSPRLSPDGQLIAYIRSGTVHSQPVELFVAATDGSFIKPVGDPTSSQDLVSIDGWTPDQAALVVSYRSSADPQPSWDQRIVPIDGSAPVPYRHYAGDEDRSPFGDRVASKTLEQLSAGCIREHYSVINLPSGAPKEFFHSDYPPSSPSSCAPGSADKNTQLPRWMGDNQHVVVSLGEQRDPAGYIVDVDTGDASTIVLSTTDEPDLRPGAVTSTTPDSTQILWLCFLSGPNGTTAGDTMAISNRDGSNFRRLPGANDIHQVVSFPGH